jgi:hypothetical protein
VTAEALVALFLLLLLLFGWWVWVATSRMDRLHRKVVASQVALDHQLVRRAMVAVELASSELMDPVSSVLAADAAWSALASAGGDSPAMVAVPPDLAVLVNTAPPSGPPDDTLTDRQASREEVESELSRTLRAALGARADVERMRALPAGPELLDELAGAWYRVHLARRFHNEAVTQARRVRRKALVRALRIAGHAPMPETFEIDDGWPEAFGDPGPTAR